MTSGWKAGELADAIRDGQVDADLDAVLSDREDIGDIIQIARGPAGLDDDSPLVQMLTSSSKTDALRQARRSSDEETMTATTGLTDTRIDATGYDVLINSMEPAAQQMLIKGAKGTGKTTKAIDIARRLFDAFDGELSIATNIKGPTDHEAVTFVNDVSGMLEWVRDTRGEKLVIGDEWSSTVNAHAGENVRQTFTRFINALRKGEGGSTRLIVIGHEHDTDIAAIVRNQSDVVLEAAGKVDEGLIDQAVLYEGWRDYQRDDEWVTLRGLSDIPDSSPWSMDTNYFATFELDLDAPSDQIRKGQLVDDWRQYQEDAGDDGEEPTPVCQATTNAGKPCPNDAKWPPDDPQVCKSHRHTLDADEVTNGGG